MNKSHWFYLLYFTLVASEECIHARASRSINKYTLHSVGFRFQDARPKLVTACSHLPIN